MLNHWKIDKKLVKNLPSEEKINKLLFEKYLNKKRPSSTKIGIPYNKIPIRLRNFLFQILIRLKKDPRFPRWPIEDVLENKRLDFIKELKSKHGEIPYIGFWPKGKFCLALTHDMDTASSFDHIDELRDIEKKYGFKSSWNVLANKYPIDFNKLRKLKEEGCEIGCHGYSHDGMLSFLPKSQLQERIDYCHALLDGFKGFRSPQLQKSDNMLDVLNEYVIYDSSMADVDIYSIVGVRSGCCSIFPYFIRDMVELPLTMPQDYRMFYTLRLSDKQILDVWKRKINFIKERGGIVTFNAHPDKHLSGSKRGLKLYDKILNYISKQDIYHDIPLEIAEWWKERNNCQIKNKKIRGSKRAKLEIFK